MKFTSQQIELLEATDRRGWGLTHAHASELLAERKELMAKIERLEATRLKGGGMKVPCPKCHNLNPYPSLDCQKCGENLRMALVVTHVVALRGEIELAQTRANTAEAENTRIIEQAAVTISELADCDYDTALRDFRAILEDGATE